MQNSIPSSASVVAKPVFAWPKPDTRPVVTFQAWASYALVAIVIAGLTLGIGRATDFFQSSTPPPVEETTIPFAGLADDEATPVPMGESSSFPYPNELNCTIEPLTRDEVVAHLEAANVATEPEYQIYGQPIVPSEEDAQGIMETFRMWQACGLSGRPLAYNLSLETPWYTANSSGAFWNAEQNEMVRPVSDERIQEFADIAVMSEEEYNLIHPPSTPSRAELDAWATEEANRSTPVYLPLPDDATPVERPIGRGWPTIFPENIEIIAPDRARVAIKIVNEFTGEVTNSPVVIHYEFVKVDGAWLIDSYEEQSPEGRG